MATGITPKLPLSIGQEGDFESIKTYEDLVRQNLKNLLLTIPGERPMDSFFGAGVQTILFQPSVGDVYGDLETSISEQVQKYMPFLELLEIRVEPNLEEESQIRVQVFYVITPLEVEDNLLLIINDIGLR